MDTRRPHHRSLIELLRGRAAHEPDRVAYRFLENGETEAGVLTYEQLDTHARRIAATLQGVAAPGDRALLLYSSGLEFICGFMGCLYANVVAVPVYPPRQNRSMNRLQAIVSNSEASIALTTQALAEKLSRRTDVHQDIRALRILATDDASGAGAEEAWAAPSVDWRTLAFLQYTSGSTGTPKGVMLSHGNLLHNFEMSCHAFGFDHTTMVAGWLPLFHDMGLIGNVLSIMYAGGQSVLMEPAAFLQKPVRWLEMISRYRATSSGAPNSAYELCLAKVSDEQKAFLNLDSWRLACNGSEPVRADTIERFAEAFAPCGFRAGSMYPCYGLAEATLFVTGGDTESGATIDVFDRSTLEHGRVKPPSSETNALRLASSGHAWLDECVVIANPKTRERCAGDEVGEIWVSGPNVATGYWKRPEESARTFHARLADGDGSFLRTGDLGFIKDGNLFVSGRLKDLIIIRGRNHHPHDIEHTAERSHAALVNNAVAAFGVEIAGAERLVVACEVRRDHQRRLDVESIAASVRQAVAEEHEVELTALVLLKPASIPRTTSGKIQRHRCRQAYMTGEGLEVVGEWRAGSFAPVALEASAVSSWLVERLAAKLGVTALQISTREPFTHFGLDSKAAIELSGELQEWLGRALPPTLFYDFPNIAVLARHLAGEDAAGGSSFAPPRTDGESAVAVVGIGCRFPWAGNPEQFWNLLHSGIDAITPPPTDRNLEGTRWGGFLERIDAFDADFFGITARETEAMDPQQRLLLEVAWESLEHAGIAPHKLAGSATGVFVGISGSDYARLQRNPHAETDAYMATGNALSIAANRISYVLDLRGPSWAIDTACSSSLVALHQACQSLLRGECELALCGGVNLILTSHLNAIFTSAGMLAPDGRCKTFDESADGYVRGEGAGVVVLKRVTEAVADGDRVLAVIRGSAVNQDGRSNGLTAPNGPSQQAVIRRALADAGVRASEIGYVEAHGTGTPLGDPIEVDSLRAVLSEDRRDADVCYIGSVKTNIGHLEAAAGIAGLIKTVLVLLHEEIPPHLHLKQLNAHIALEDVPFSIPSERKSWPRGARRRLAGVSSFGFGGTNAHVILEEAPAAFTTADAHEERLRVVALSAKSPAALDELTAAYARFIDAHPETELAEIAYTSNVCRTHFDQRIAAVAATTRELRAQLERPRFRGAKASSREPRVAFLFTGQGSQFPGMGKRLYETQASFRRTLERCDAALRPYMERSLLEILYPAAGAATPLDETAYTQPALFALEYALAELWIEWGINPAVVMGHSVGEFVAACVAGVFSAEEGVRLVAERGRLMQSLPRTGAMMSVFTDEATAMRLAEPYTSVAVAAVNAPQHTVISGEANALEEIAAELTSRGVETRKLNVSHAFHSPLMESVVGAGFAAAARRVNYAPSKLPVISNVSGTVSGGEMSGADYWVGHVLAPVRFADGMESLRRMEVDVFLEIGPSATLLALGQDCLGAGRQSWLSSLRRGADDDAVMLDGLASLYCLGAQIDWARVGIPQVRRRVALPTYPFQRRRYWLESPAGESAHESRTNGHGSRAPERATVGHPLLGRRLADLAHLPDTLVWETQLGGETASYFEGHRVMGVAVLPYAAYVEMALAAAAASAETPCGGSYRISDLELHHPLFLPGDDSRVLQIVLKRLAEGSLSFDAYYRAGDTAGAGESKWILCASAGIRSSV